MNVDVKNCDCVEYMRLFPDEYFQLVIVDPPYYKVKGKFDFIWPSFEAYKEDVEQWAREIKRVLAPNGSLLWYGHALKIAHSQVILDKHFDLVNSLVWNKIDCQTKRSCFADLRQFAPVTERILFYEAEGASKMKTGRQLIHSDPDLFRSIKDYMVGEKEKAGLTNKDINLVCGNTTVSSHNFANSQWSFISELNYLKLQSTGYWQKDYLELQLEYQYLLEEYEPLRQELEDLRRSFDNSELKLTDVLDYYAESHVTGKYNHPTQKPPTLTSHLIQMLSREGDNVLVPFGGSGVELVEGMKLGRNMFGSELDAGYYETILKRVEETAA